MSTELIRAPLVLVAVVALGGCGATSAQHGTAGDRSGSALGRMIGTTPAVAATGSTAAARPRPTTATPPPESIRLPPPPSAAAPRSRAILRVASRFANAYLLYQVGRDLLPVQQAIRETCTRSFAQLLLSEPVNIPATQRQSVAGQPSALGSVRYTGPASLGPGAPLQIVIARYHPIAHPNAGGQLTIGLTVSGGGWRVDTLR
jgi:hypothetical protein